MIFTGDGQQLCRFARRIVEAHQGVDSDRGSKPEGRTTSDRRPPRDERDHLPAADRMSVGRDTCGIREREHLLSPLQAMARGRGLCDGSRRDAHILRRQGWHRVGLGCPSPIGHPGAGREGRRPILDRLQAQRGAHVSAHAAVGGCCRGPGRRRRSISLRRETAGACAGQAARRSYRWCRPPTSGRATISPMAGGHTSLGSGASLLRDRCVRDLW